MFFNLHLQPSSEQGAAKQTLSEEGEKSVPPVPLSCRETRHGSTSQAAVLTTMLFCESLGGIPEGSVGGGQLTQGLCVKQTETGLFCPLFDLATGDPSHSTTTFNSICFVAVSLQSPCAWGCLSHLNSERLNFFPVTSPASLVTAKGFNAKGLLFWK